MSISSILSPSAWASRIAGGNPLAAAAVYGAGSFAGTLMQALKQAGGAAASSAGAALTGAVHGHHHGHHRGGPGALQSLLQSPAPRSATASTAGRLLDITA